MARSVSSLDQPGFDLLPSDSQAPDAFLVRRKAEALSVLTSRQRQAVELRLEGLSLTVIGERMGGITQSRVSQLVSVARHKMRVCEEVDVDA